MPSARNRPRETNSGPPEMPPPDALFSGAFSFDPADPIYAEHFPGFPVVPGSVVISAFLQAGQAAAPGMKGVEVQNFKFRTFITPGGYAYRLERRGDDLQCRLFPPGAGGSRPLVTGTIRLQPAPEASAAGEG